MSIAEKLIQIAENEQKVHDAGYAKGVKKGSEQGYNNGYTEGFDAGKQAEYDAFWDAYQEKGERKLYVDGFCRGGWNAVTYNPKYPIVGGTYGLQSLFSNSYVVDTKVDLIVRGDGNIKAAFNGCKRLIRIPSLILEVPITDCANAFTNCSNLEEINITTTGNGCIAATVDLKQCTKLSRASIESVFFCLDEVYHGVARSVTFSLEAVNKAFEESEGANNGSTSMDWFVLLTTIGEDCGKWTISLV